MATENVEGMADIDNAMDLMLSPEVFGETEKVEDEQETVEEATTDEDADEHSEETEADEETEEEDSEESEEAEDDSEEEESEEDSEEGDVALHTVTVDGEEIQVPLDELKRGYSGQQYVQKQMQSAAEARKQAESVFLELQSERQQIAQVASLIESGQLARPPVEPPKDQFESDPIGYMEARIRYDEEMEAYKQHNGALQNMLQQKTEAEQRSMQAYLDEQFMQLKTVEPDFNDPEKAQVIRAAMTKVSEEVYGYKPEEIAAVTDHRAIRVLRDAARWQELQATKGKTREKVTKNVAKRGKRKSTKTTTGESRRRKQRDLLRKTGSDEAALSLMIEGG